MTRQMKHFNFPVRNLDGTFYAQVHPFDPSLFLERHLAQVAWSLSVLSLSQCTTSRLAPWTRGHSFDPSYFAVKVHPSEALLFTPHHLQLTLLQHLIIQSPFLKQPVQFLADIPKYWHCTAEGHEYCLSDSMASTDPAVP